MVLPLSNAKIVAEDIVNALEAAVLAAVNADAAQGLVNEAQDLMDELENLDPTYDTEYLQDVIDAQQVVVDGMFDVEAVATAKAALEFNAQSSNTINKPADNNGVSFTLAVSNLDNEKPGGIFGREGNAVLQPNGNISITRKVNGILDSGSEAFTFDMTVTMQRGAATDTKVFVVTVPKGSELITFAIK